MTDALLQVQFLGLDEGADPKALPPGTLLRAENCAMDKHRRLVIRDGTKGLAKTRFDSGSVSAGTRILPYPKGGIGICNGETEFTRNALATPTWKPIEVVTPFSLETRPLADATRGIDYVDQIVSGDLLFVVYATTATGTGAGSEVSKLYLRVDNRVTGQNVYGPKLVPALSGYKNPRLLLGASGAFLIVQTAAGIFYYTVSLTTFAISASATVLPNTTDAAATTVYDAVVGTSSAGEVIYVAYELAAGAARLQVRSYLTSSLAQDDAITVSSSGDTFESVCIAYCPLASKVAVIWSSGSVTDTLATVLSVDLVSSTAATVIGTERSSYCFIAEDSATHCVVGYQQRTVTWPEGILRTGKADFATLAQAAETLRATWRMYAPSKPWKVNSRWFFAATVLVIKDGTTTESIPAASVVACEIRFEAGVSAISFPHVQVANLENQTGWLARVSPTHITKAAIGTDTSVIYVPAPYRYREPATDGELVEVLMGWNLHKLDTYATVGDLVGESDDLLRAAPIGDGALLAGAVCLWADGSGAMPYGFQHAPKIHSVTAVTGGGLLAGVYSYIAVYAWTDALGVKHRSAPSPAMTGTTAGADLTLDVAVCTASLSSKQQDGRLEFEAASPVTIELYRTIIGGAGDHYKLIETDGISRPNAATATMSDALPDSDISSGATVTLASQEKVYTETGELPDNPPPAGLTSTTHRGRLWVLDPTRRTAWASKNQTENPRVAPGFNAAFVLGFASDKYAFASLDEKLVVFGENDIDTVYGEGPTVDGLNNDWQIQRVQSDVGTKYPRSVVTCPAGVAFLSTRGIELLDRGLNVTWIGRAVQTTLATYPVITSAVLVPEHEEIRFTCQTTSGVAGNGIVLAYDYVAKMWFTRPYTDAGTASKPMVDAALISGVYTMLTAGGKVYQEDPTYSLDDWDVTASWVGFDVILAPVSPAGNLAWTRVKDVSILGTSVTNHDLKVSVARNYATSYEQDNTFVAGGEATVVGPLEKCRVSMMHQKCHAIQVRIQSLTPTSPGTYPVTTGKGPILEAVAFRFSKRPGVAKTSAGQQA